MPELTDERDCAGDALSFPAPMGVWTPLRISKLLLLEPGELSEVLLGVEVRPPGITHSPEIALYEPAGGAPAIRQVSTTVIT